VHGPNGGNECAWQWSAITSIAAKIGWPPLSSASSTRRIRYIQRIGGAKKSIAYKNYRDQRYLPAKYCLIFQ
jgi:hypothetical protein